MIKKFYKCIIFLILITILISINPILNFINYSDKNIVLNNLLLEENKSLKDEIKELSGLDYTNYNHILGKITIKNLYNEDIYHLYSNEPIEENLPVIGSNGIIGLTNLDNTIRTLKDISLSVKINDKKYALKKGIITTNEFDGNIGDTVYTSGLTSIPANIEVGKISNIIKEENNYLIEVSLNKVINNYVAIIKG